MKSIDCAEKTSTCLRTSDDSQAEMIGKNGLESLSEVQVAHFTSTSCVLRINCLQETKEEEEINVLLAFPPELRQLHVL